jgi:hypothetical protein
MEPRNLNRPSYVLAAALGIVAIVDALNALTGMQTAQACYGNICGGGNNGWFTDLVTSGVCAAFVALLLMRPHLYVFAAVVGWSFIAFLANFVLRHTPGVDTLATYRMAAYFLALVVAGVLVVVEGEKWYRAEMAKRPVAPVVQPQPQPWAGQPWQGQYPGAPMAPGAPVPQGPAQWGGPSGYPVPQQQPQYAPPAPPAPPAPAVSPAPPAAPAASTPPPVQDQK